MKVLRRAQDRFLDRVQQTVALRLETVSVSQALLVALLVAALFTRFWRLDTPGDFYFDEVYFPKTAQEILHGDRAAWEFFGHENTHPPLSKLFMAGGMAFFGENAFGWRFFGALAGVGSVLFVYLLGRRLFNSEFVGLAAGFLMTFEGLGFAQSRIATPDAYVLFFVLGSIYFLVSDRLPLSGIFLGAALACKLTALLTVFPIVMYFLYRYWQMEQGRWGKLLYVAPLSLLAFYLGTPVLFGNFLVDEVQPGVLRPDLPAPVFNAALGSWMALWALTPPAVYFIHGFLRSREGQEEDALADSLITLPLVFVVAPLYIYFMSYLPMLLNGHGIRDVFLLNRDAFQFHSTLEQGHPYQAPWDTWPILKRPVFFHLSGEAKIYNLGNPIIFWFGLPALGFALWQGLKGVRARLDTLTGRLSVWGTMRPEEAAPLFVVLTYIALWLPWAIQPRVMFLYHYMPALAFLILALAYALHRLWRQSWGPVAALPAVAGAAFLVLAPAYASRPFLAIGIVSFLALGWAYVMERRWGQPWGATVVAAFLAAVGITFVYFYPQLAAVPVGHDWGESYFWFSSWR